MSSIAIIGTREPDEGQKSLTLAAAEYLTALGHTITTGAAFGIDELAMQAAAPGKLLVYLPWASYNLGIVPGHATRIVYDPKIHKKWSDSVFQYHPAPNRLSRGAFLLHARNYGIVEHVVCVLAFPNETGGGGTGQGIRVARGLGIPVIQTNRGQAGMTFDSFAGYLGSNIKEIAA